MRVWTPIALSRDVAVETTRAVVLGGDELVLWRGASGALQLWEDRCPHRGMRLSFGFVRGNRLNCLYHGWEYAADARCMRIPAHPDLVVPPTIRARPFAVVESGAMVWTSAVDAAPALEPEAGLVPVASLAIDGPVTRTLAALGGTPAENRQAVSTTVAGAAIRIGWHTVAEHRVMLHVAADRGADVASVLLALRALRADIERIAA